MIDKIQFRSSGAQCTIVVSRAFDRVFTPHAKYSNFAFRLSLLLNPLFDVFTRKQLRTRRPCREDNVCFRPADIRSVRRWYCYRFSSSSSSSLLLIRFFFLPCVAVCVSPEIKGDCTILIFSP